MGTARVTQSFALPQEYDPRIHMLTHEVSGRVFHATIPSVRLAAELMASGAADAIAEAAAIFGAVLATQQTRVGDPHHGNFRWEMEDEVVEDLNAVQFVLFGVIPALIERSGSLPPTLVDDLHAAVRLGLQEIARIDVSPAYTNIVLKDITNSCLGGQLLDDQARVLRGREKLERWMSHVDAYGLPAEYNSPNYAAVAVGVLGRLASLVQDEDTRIRARIMLARLGLSAAMHIHPASNCWAGPFSRAYRHAVFNPDAFGGGHVREWIECGWLPPWLDSLLDRPTVAHQVDETAHGEEPVSLSTYHSPSFALGVASCELKTQEIIFIALQSCVFHAQYQRGPGVRPGVLFSRYVLDDQWLSFQTTPSREPGQVIPEEGHFYGVHDEGRAIGLYTPRGLDAWTRRTSARVVLMWTEFEHVDEIWIGSQQVHELPVAVPRGEVVVVGSGGLWTAVRPLQFTDLGGGTPIRLVELDGHLALEMYHYSGPAKTFWEMARPGSFYQGQPRGGFYAELAERTAHASGADLAATVAAGALRDDADPPTTYEAGRERLYTVEYTRGDRSLGLEVDLFEWQLRRRWNQDGDLGWPMHQSPYAQQSATGQVSMGGTTLTCGDGPVWLCAMPDAQRFVAIYSGRRRTSLQLEVPGEVVEIADIGAGWVMWDEGEVSAEAVGGPVTWTRTPAHVRE